MNRASRCIVTVTAAAALSSGGCFSYQTLGVKDGAFVAARQAPLACVDNTGGLNGLSGTMTEGQLDGAPALRVADVGPLGSFTPTFVERRDVSGMHVWAGQRCMVGMGPAPVCDDAALFENGDRRVYVFRTQRYPSMQALPTSVEGMVKQLELGRWTEAVAAIDLDDPESQEAFKALREMRRTHRALQATAQLAAAAGSVNVKGKGAATVKTVSKDVADLARNLDKLVPSDERPLFEAHPKLLALPNAISLVAEPPPGQVGASTVYLCVGTKPGP